MDAAGLFFRAAADAPPIRDGRDAEDAFVEGLWECDVAELFLLNPGTGYYVEFNLAPGGAWWCCAFDAPRRRVASGPAPLRGVRGKAVVGDDRESPGTGGGWESALAIPLASLPGNLAFNAGATKGNIAFCLGRPQRYVTLADLGGGEPDFHRPRRWLPLGGMLTPPYSGSPNY